MRSSVHFLLCTLSALALGACGGPDESELDVYGQAEADLLFGPAPVEVMPPLPVDDAPVPREITVGSDAPAPTPQAVKTDSTPDPIPIDTINIQQQSASSTSTSGTNLGCALIKDTQARLRCNSGG